MATGRLSNISKVFHFGTLELVLLAGLPAKSASF
jgi:hypothetical protein